MSGYFGEGTFDITVLSTLSTTSTTTRLAVQTQDDLLFNVTSCSITFEN